MPAEYKSACCDRREQQIQNYLDASLGAGEIADLEAHAAQCPACAGAMISAAAAHLALRSAAASLPSPGDLYPGFAARLQQTQKTRLFPYSFSQVSAGMAVAACLGALWMYQHPSPTAVSQGASQNNNQVAVITPELKASGGSENHKQIAKTDSAPVHIAKAGAGNGANFAAKRSQARAQVHHGLTHQLLRLAVQAPPSLATVNGVVTNGSSYRRLSIAGVAATRDRYTAVLPPRPEETAAISNQITATGKPPFKDNGTANAPSNAGEFALVVQDDVRGFTSEVRGNVVAENREDRRLNSSADVHVEVLRDSDP
jgi:anti-sigma factor RsiW